jgi:predicted nucleic acid-binding protein
VGTLSLPPYGVVYADANSIIYRVEQVQSYLAVAAPLWDALDAGRQEVLTSELSVLEVLVKPIRLGDPSIEKLFRQMLYWTRGFSLAPISRTVLEEAARLRALTGLKTPDAIHAATALLGGCALFVTNDPAFRRVPGLRVAVLFEIAAAP